MKKALGLVFLLLTVGLMFAQPHSVIGYVYESDGVTPHNDFGIHFSTTQPYQQDFYWNWPGMEDNAPGTQYIYSDGTCQIQIDVFLFHYQGMAIDVQLSDNDYPGAPEIFSLQVLRAGGSVTQLVDPVTGENIAFGGEPVNPGYDLGGNIGMQGVVFTGVGTNEAEVTSDEYGDWAFTCDANANVTITPAKEGYTFAPESYINADVQADDMAIEFVATQWAPDMPMNPYPANGSNGVATELPYLWWDAPEAGVAPTSYFVTLSMNADYSAPIIDNMETADLMYAIPAATLAEGTMYYAKVTPHYAPPTRAAMGLKNDVTTRNASKSSKTRDFGVALEWAFETYAPGGNNSQNGGDCNGADPITIELPGVTVIIDPIAGVTAFIVVDWTDLPGNMPGFGAPAVVLPGFLFGFNINAGDPSNLNGTIELNVGMGLDIAAVFYHNDGGAWVLVEAPATWSYVGGILTIEGLNLSTRTGGDIELAVHDGTVPVEFSAFNATFMEEGNVLLQWTTETETDMMGYYVLRSETGDQNDAIRINPSVIAATNSSITTDYQLVDDEVEIGEYSYWIEAVGYNGYTLFHGPQTVTVTDNDPVMPAFTSLEGAYPNPFNPETNIKFNVAEGETATLTIYNVLGQVVKTMGTYEAKADGHVVQWHGTDDNNNNVGSGIYFYRLESDSYKCIKKMLLLK